MKNLIKAEWFKLSKSLGFKVLLLCNAAAIISTGLLIAAGAKSPGYEMLVISLSYTLHHAIIGYLFAAFFICGEFTNRTFGMSLLCGSSRGKVFLSKVFVFLSGMFLLFLVYTGTATIVASVANGFGLDWNLENCKEILLLLFCGVSGCMAIGAVILLVATLARKTIITIGAGIGITYALMWTETAFRAEPLPFVKYIYTYQIGQLTSWGDGFSVGMFLMVTVLTTIVALVTSTVVFEKMELK